MWDEWWLRIERAKLSTSQTGMIGRNLGRAKRSVEIWIGILGQELMMR
jgi:hypothetical protein